jgi:hypothetical protein
MVYIPHSITKQYFNKNTDTGMHEVHLTKNVGKKGEQMCHSSELVERRVETLHHEITNIRVNWKRKENSCDKNKLFFYGR